MDEAGHTPEKPKQRMRRALERMRDLSPEELRQRARQAVAKGTATVAGAMEGLAERIEPGVAREATRKVGETAREVTRGVKEEVGKAKEEAARETEERRPPPGL